jgi:tubulin polyglutamylase TTLL1
VLFEEEKREIMVKYDNGEKCGKDNKVAIAQKYISNPFLYKGHKIEFRIYFFIESTMPVIAYSYKR